MNKTTLKRTSCEVIAQWIRANLSAGCMTFYGEKNGLSDEEIRFMENYMSMEADKMEVRSYPPIARKKRGIDYPEPDDNLAKIRVQESEAEIAYYATYGYDYEE